ncbi:MAG: transcription elongation factor GreA [Clostridia bacterium]|nr:transcription elongation factor GreA [Clostridia bacterium]
MEMAEIFMTAEGKKQLEERLKDLKVNGRAEMAEKIRVAREFGDLSENAEYDIAKEEQAKMEAEIIEIEAKLRNVQIIDEKVKGDKADVGSKIEIKDVKTGAVYSYTIVGTHESNPMEGRISNESPIGKAVLGKRKGAEVVVKAPMGDAVYKIVDIK